MNIELQILEAILRFVGGFYCLGAVIGARMVTRYSFLDHAIEAISGKTQKWAERWRDRLMLAGLVPVFASGLALMSLSPAAPWLFAVGTIWQAAYLGWLAPAHLESSDPADAEGRAKTWRAFWIYGAVTALVLWAAFAGLLRGPASPLALGAGALLTAAFAAWMAWSMRNTLKGGGSALGRAIDPVELSESGFKIRQPADIPIILRPSWTRGWIFAADTNHPVGWGWQEEYLSETARALVTDLDILFRDVADPFDPRRCAFEDPDGARRIEECAQDALRVLREELGAERLAFVPRPEPEEPVMQADRVKIEPFSTFAVIWSLDEPIDKDPRPIFEDEFGISFFLARSLNHWAEDWREAHKDENGEPLATDFSPRWTPADFDAHEEQGRVLAVRLKRELVATGRERVMVYYMTRKVGLLEAHADDHIPPLPPRFSMTHPEEGAEGNRSGSRGRFRPPDRVLVRRSPLKPVWRRPASLSRRPRSRQG